MTGLHIAALLALFVHPDERTVAQGATTIGSSDVVTWVETFVSLGFATAAVVLARFGFVQTEPERPSSS